MSRECDYSTFAKHLHGSLTTLNASATFGVDFVCLQTGMPGRQLGVFVMLQTSLRASSTRLREIEMDLCRTT